MSTQAAVLRTMAAVAAELEAEGAEIIGGGIGGISPPSQLHVSYYDLPAHIAARGEFLQENGQHDEYGYTDRDVVVMWLVRKEQSDAQS